MKNLLCNLSKKSRKVTQLLEICIGPTIHNGRESWCLPYAGFFQLVSSLQSSILYIMGKLAGEGLWLWLSASVTDDRWNLTPDTWHMICDTWYVTCDTWQMRFFFCFPLSLCSGVGAIIRARREEVEVWALSSDPPPQVWACSQI